MGIVGAGIGYAAVGFLSTKILSSLMKPKEQVLESGKPAPLSERGSPVPLLVGRHRIAPVFAWEGGRRTATESGGSGGGGGKGVGSAGGGNNTVFRANGMHVLCVGPAKRLRSIRWNGEKVWPHDDSGGLVSQDIGIASHEGPSGSQFSVKNTDEGNNRGVFRIYWGEPDQPTDDLLVSSTGLNTFANHGHICYVVWEDARLGGAGVWPNVEYDIDVGPYHRGQVYAEGLATPDYDGALAPNKFTEMGYDDGGLNGSDGAGAAWFTDGLAVSDEFSYPIISYDPSTKVMRTCRDGKTTTGLDAGSALYEIGGNSATADGRYYATFAEVDNVNVLMPDDSTLASVRTSGLPQGRDGFRMLYPEYTMFIQSQPRYSSTMMVGDYEDKTDMPTGRTRNASWQGLRGNDQGVRYDLIHDSSTVGADIRYGTVHDPIYTYTADYYNFNICVKLPNHTTVGAGVKFKMYFLEGDTSTSGTSGTNVGYQDFELVYSQIGQGLSATTSSGSNVRASWTFISNGWYEVNVQLNTADSPALVGNKRMMLGITTDPLSGSTGSRLSVAYGYANGFTPVLREQSGTLCVDAVDFTFTEGPANVEEFAGTISALLPDPSGPQGANLAHILYQLLFQSAPHGLGLDKDCYDLQSFYQLGLLFDEERLHSHAGRSGDQSLEGVIENLCLEGGVQKYWDVATGKWGVKAVRAEQPLATFPEDHIAPDPPESERAFGRATPSDLRYVFTDAGINFRENDIYIPLDSEAATDIKRQDLTSVRDEFAAEQVADRLAQIEQSRPMTLRLVGLRDSQMIRVSDVLSFGELFGPEKSYRVVEVEMDPMRATTRLSVADESISAEPIARSAFSGSTLAGPLQAAAVAVVTPDADLNIYEASAFLGRHIQFVALRLPSQEQASRAALITSPDGISYVTEGGASTVPCGTLLSDFGEDVYEEVDATNTFQRRYFLEEGPLFRAVANSVQGKVSSLTEADWAAGRQWLVINDEIMYVQEFEPLGNDVWRAKNVLRARLDSTIQDHVYGDSVFVLKGADLPLFSVPHAGQGLDLYVKTLPVVQGATAPAASVTETVVTTSARGIRPIELRHLREENFIDGWSVRDTTYRWSYSLPEGRDLRTGLGMQGAGEETPAATSAWPGTFIVDVRDSRPQTPTNPDNNVIYGPVTVTDPEVTVPSSAMSSAVPGFLTLSVTPVDQFGDTGARAVRSFLQA